MTELKAGVARRIITPPTGIYQIGYGDRTKGNIGVHDDLTATVLVLDDGTTRIAIVALDMLTINEFVVDRVRARCKAGFESRPTEVLLCCSHTHSGPIAFADKKSSRKNQAYINSLVDNIVAAVKEATSNAVPARLEYSSGEADIAINRREKMPNGRMEIGRNPDGVVDRSVQVISVFSLTHHPSPREALPKGAGRGDGGRVVTLINFACHGTVLGPDNLLISADWIGAMRAKVESELGGMSLFLQGATANLNPDMFWEDAHAFEMVAEQGDRVAQSVVAAVKKRRPKIVEGTEPLNALPLQVERTEAWLPTETKVDTPRPPKNYGKPLLSMANLPKWMAFLADPLLNYRYPWKPRIEARDGFWSVPMRVNTVRIGELALVTFAAETFTEIGMAVKAASPAKHTLFASITDGCISYLHTAASHPEGGYEVDVAPLAYRYPGRLSANCESIALDTARTCLAKLWQENIKPRSS
jgi:neutral ceramidase